MTHSFPPRRSSDLDGHDVHAAVADDQVNRHLHAAIESLPPLQRTLLTLYHLEELSIPEISRITGIAEGTIKSHLFRSRKQLRDRKSTRLNSSHSCASRMPSSA